MSLFPAYSEPSPSTTDKNVPNNTDSSWLTNPSFNAEDIKPAKITNPQSDDDVEIIPTSDKAGRSVKSPKAKKRKKEKKNKREDKKRERKQSPVIQFTGKEEYYVDKNASKGYSSVETLHKPARPRYNISSKFLGGFKFRRIFEKRKRYFTQGSSTSKPKTDCDDKIDDETEFVLKVKEFNEYLHNNPSDIAKWVDFMNHQSKICLKLSNTQIAEKKMEILERALKENSKNSILLENYIDVVTKVFPSDVTSVIVEKLLLKDPTSYVLWEALINATQGSMARCVVPDVLKLYERCMQTLYNKLGDDKITLRLFKNLTLFLRQSGLYEQFFALIKLALDLNISANKCKDIVPQETDQQLLIEYEEVILQSGLPMNEIWLRIEKLRQNFYFLPCPENLTCPDPQRIVFNGDICNFIFPLSKRENGFRLVLEIMKLLKLPIALWDDSTLSEFDDIEKLMAVFLEMSFASVEETSIFNGILFDLVKEMNVGPSFVNNQIGWEIYLNAIRDMLFLLAECFDNDSVRRNVIITIWFKLERLVLLMDKFSGKLKPETLKSIKSKIKNLLRKDEYRNETVLYVEYGKLEYDAGNVANAENIFHASITQNEDTENRSAIYYSFISWIEVLIATKNYEKAIKLLLILGLKTSTQDVDGLEITEPKKLSVLKKFEDRIVKMIFIEKNVEILELEQHFMPDYFLNLIKANVYFLMLIKSSASAMCEVERLIRVFPEGFERHKFLRQGLYEIYFKVAEFSKGSFKTSVLKAALAEFPSNLSILRFTSTSTNDMWINFRKLLTASNASPISIIFLITAARYRFLQIDTKPSPFLASSNIDMNETIFKNRVVNILKTFTSKTSKLVKNPLLWRLYLRSLFAIEENLERCKNILFSALDECPWNKALYLDGAVYVPHELAQLQDLIIEKQLRIYALPEELEILRNDTFS